MDGGLRVMGVYKKSAPGKPLVSIVTITRNSASSIECAIKSVVSQDYGNVEYIVVDGASTDGTTDIIRRYDGSIDYWIIEPDAGISNAFNKGLSFCRGDIIGIINADDWYEPGAVTKAVAAFKDPTVDIVCGLVQYWEGDKKRFIRSSHPEKLKIGMYINHPSVFVRKSVYQSFGVFDEEYKYAMDYELLLRFKEKGAKFSSLNSVNANMRLAGTSDRNWEKALRETWTAKKKNLGKGTSIDMRYYTQLAKSKISRRLEKWGLERVNTLYRRRMGRIEE
jgi:glycosyltransferase involved in cell wall biosynthesis